MAYSEVQNLIYVIGAPPQAARALRVQFVCLLGHFWRLGPQHSFLLTLDLETFAWRNVSQIHLPTIEGDEQEVAGFERSHFLNGRHGYFWFALRSVSQNSEYVHSLRIAAGPYSSEVHKFLVGRSQPMA